MQIDDMIAKRHLTTHPFYKKWQSGEVSLETLRDYAKQYYAYEAALPRFLRNSLEHLDGGPARRAVEENILDETGNPKPHSDLWMQFAEALGLSRKEVRSAATTPATARLVDTYETLSKQGSAESLGALYAYESQFAEVAKTKADGLRTFYGINDPQALEFFDWHSENDDEHGDALKTGLDDGPANRAAVEEALDAWWGMLDQFV